MNKIINNKKYDTNTARKICCISEGLVFDENYLEETLYQKSSGEYFLVCQGQSKYISEYGVKGYSPDQKYIIPLKYNQAYQWSMEVLDGDAFEALFGEVEE